MNEAWAQAHGKPRGPLTGLVCTDAPARCRPFLSNNLAGRVHHTWSASSRACDYHAYELAPSAPGLEAWIRVTEDFAAVAGAKDPSRS